MGNRSLKSRPACLKPASVIFYLSGYITLPVSERSQACVCLFLTTLTSSSGLKRNNFTEDNHTSLGKDSQRTEQGLIYTSDSIF